MIDVLRFPVLVFAFVVDRLRRLPGARFVAPLVRWLPQLFVLVAVVLLLLWSVEASPQRMSLADLAAGNLSRLQSWIIVSGELQDVTAPSASTRTYRLTDPAAPNAHLDVRSRVLQPLGWATVSGRIEGGHDGVPPGYAWSARLNADPVLANELPPPMVAFVLIFAAILIILARRTSYPLFLHQVPSEVPPTRGGLRVVAHGATGPAGERDPSGILHLETGSGAAELRIIGTRPTSVRLHSAFTSVDVGELRSLTSVEPALRVRAADDDLILGFASNRDRDAAFATFVEGTVRLGAVRQAPAR